MHQYDLWSGLALVGGLFSHTQLMQMHEFFIIFDAMKKSVDNHSFIHLKNVLQTASRSMGVQLVERIKKVGHALIDLQRVSNVSSSMDMGNLQPHDQDIWNSIFEANSNSGWTSHSLPSRSNWGLLTGGKDLLANGDCEIWEGLHDKDNKFLRGYDDFLV